MSPTPAMSSLLPHVDEIRELRPHAKLVDLAAKYNVSDVTLRAFCKQHGIKPKRSTMEIVRDNRAMITQRLKNGASMTALASELRVKYEGFKYACIKQGIHRVERSDGKKVIFDQDFSATNRLLMMAWR